MQHQESYELISRPPRRSSRHAYLKLAFSFGITFLVAVLFLGSISLDPYYGYFHSPDFPLEYNPQSGLVITNHTYQPFPAFADFLFWYTIASLGVFAIIALLTANSTMHIGRKLSLPKKKANLLGLLIVVALLFTIFVPVVPTPGGQFTGCNGFTPNQHCTNVTQVGSVTYSLFCEGAIWDYPTIAYTLTECLFG